VQKNPLDFLFRSENITRPIRRQFDYEEPTKTQVYQAINEYQKRLYIKEEIFICKVAKIYEITNLTSYMLKEDYSTFRRFS
jgi:hypothetical protein